MVHMHSECTRRVKLQHDILTNPHTSDGIIVGLSLGGFVLLILVLCVSVLFAFRYMKKKYKLMISTQVFLILTDPNAIMISFVNKF